MNKLISSGSSFEEKLGYSRAVIRGDWAFVSGVTGYDYNTMDMPNNIAQQASNCFKTIQTSLNEGGFSLSDTVRVQYTLTNPDLVDEIAPVLKKYMGNIKPAATMIIASSVLFPDPFRPMIPRTSPSLISREMLRTPEG